MENKNTLVKIVIGNLF